MAEQTYMEYLLGLKFPTPSIESREPRPLSYIDYNLGYYLKMINKGIILPLHEGEEVIILKSQETEGE